MPAMRSQRASTHRLPILRLLQQAAGSDDWCRIIRRAGSFPHENCPGRHGRGFCSEKSCGGCHRRAQGFPGYFHRLCRRGTDSARRTLAARHEEPFEPHLLSPCLTGRGNERERARQREKKERFLGQPCGGPREEWRSGCHRIGRTYGGARSGSNHQAQNPAGH